MNSSQLVLSEVFSRPISFLLTLSAVTVASTLFVGGPTLIDAYVAKTKQDLETLQNDTDELLGRMDDETRKIMRDIGVNLRIVHEDTNMGDLHSDFSAVEFPEDYVQRLATSSQIETVVHLVATLQHKMKWNGRTILLVGVNPVLTNSQKNAEKKHMMKRVEPGTVVVGHELAGALEVGQMLDINGHQFKVASIQPEQGTRADIQLMLDLADAQKVTDKRGQINQILALNCKCKGNRISKIRSELEDVLPDTKVTEMRGIAEAREQQRDEVAKTRKDQLALVVEQRDQQSRSMQLLASVVVPLGILVCATFVGIQTWLNVRERRVEIGVLRALGKTTVEIASLFLVKSFAIGVFGGVFGCGLGYLGALLVGQQTMQLPVEFFQVNWPLLGLTVLGAPLVAAMAAYLPTLKAILQDPSVVLMDQ